MKFASSLMTALLFSFILFTEGCIGTASSGSRSRVLNGNALKGVSVVCLFPVYISAGDSTYGSDDSTNTQLWREIDSRKFFPLIPRETVKSTLLANATWDSLWTCRIARSLGAETFILARLNYSKKSYRWKLSELVAELSLKLVDARTDSVIAYGVHNTYHGNSYFLPPELETVRADAIKGAVDALADAISKE